MGSGGGTPNVPIEPGDVRELAAKVCARLRRVYRDEYIVQCAREEPGSLLGLVVRLEEALKSAQILEDVK